MLVLCLLASVVAVSGAVDAPAAAAEGGNVEWVSGAGDFNPWGTGFPVPTTPTDPAQARYTVYATSVVATPGGIYIRDYDTIVKVDPTSGVTQRVAGFYPDSTTPSPYPVIPDGVGQDSTTVGTGWSRNLGVLADGRLMFDATSGTGNQVFTAPPTGGTIEVFAGDGTGGPPTQGAAAVATGLEYGTDGAGLFGTASGGAWIVSQYDENVAGYGAHHVAADGTISNHVLPATSQLRTVVGDDIVTLDAQDVSADPENPSWALNLYVLSPDGTVVQTPVSGDCASAVPAATGGSPAASVGVEGGFLRFIGQYEDPPTYSYPKVGCSVDLTTGASASTSLAPAFDDWLSGADDGTYWRKAESPATWDPVTQSWWFVGRTSDSAGGGGYSLALYRHHPGPWVDPVSHDLTVTLDGTGTGSITSDPAGVDCGTVCMRSFSAGEEVTLTASAEPGSVFDGWTGEGCSGTGPCTVSLDQDHVIQATFSHTTAPTGRGEIVYSGTPPGGGSSQLFLLDVESGTSSAVPGTTGASHPAWSNDETRVAYNSSNGLQVMDLVSGAITTVFAAGTLPAGGPQSVDWSPDDRWLTFSASSGARTDVWVVPADGSDPPTNLTNSATTFDSHPTWSPDGRIAWRKSPSTQEVWVAQFDSSTMTLTNPAGLANSTTVPSQQRPMDWSPDGSSLVLSAAVNAALNDDVYVLPADGVGPLRQLTTDAADDSDPAWSPDGSQIVFTSDRSGEFDLHTVDVDGEPGEEAVLHTRAGSDRSPDWANSTGPLEDLPVIQPGGAGVMEGDAGSVTVEVPVSLSAPSAQPVTVEWSTLDTGGAGVATADVDYAAASGTVTFAPGETTATVSITVYGDTEHEPPLLWGEWALVSFSNPSTNAALDTSFYGLGVGVVFDDDA